MMRPWRVVRQSMGAAGLFSLVLAAVLLVAAPAAAQPAAVVPPPAAAQPAAAVQAPLPGLQVPQPELPGPWSSLKTSAGSADFHFAIVADRTGAMRSGVFEAAMPKLNLLRPDFVINVGDLIEGYTEEQATLDAQWAEVRAAVGQLKMPFFYVPGNHDYGNPTQAANWLKLFGRPYYHFTYRDVLFLCINTIVATSGSAPLGVDDAQFDYFKKVLDENPRPRWTVVVMHYPLWTYEPARTARWPDLEKLLAARRHTVFAGHTHLYTKTSRHGESYIMVSTTGGGNRLRGENFGELEHLVWVTMTDGGPVVANLLLDGIRDENIRDEATALFVQQTGIVDRLYIAPLYLNPPLAEELTIKLQLRNIADRPFKFAGVFQPNEFLTPASATVEKEVGPGATATVEVKLKVNTRLDLAAFKPLELKASYTFKLDGRPDLVHESAKFIGQPVIGGRWIVEAEDMVLDGYLARRFVPSNRGHVRLTPGTKTPATARGVLAFPGPTGSYKVTLVGIPSANGSPKLTLCVGGKEVASGAMTKSPDWKDATKDKFEIVAERVQIEAGQELRLEGASDDRAEPLVDQIIFEPVTVPASAATAAPAAATISTATAAPAAAPALAPAGR